MQYLEPRKGRVEIIPMIDIMLFLLVFFIMITIRMIPTQGMPAALPGATTAQELPHPKILLTLRPDGTVEMDGHPIALPELALRLRANDPARTQVTIAADRKADVQALVKVMDACREVGVGNIGLAAKPEG